MVSYFDALPESFSSSAFVDGVKLWDYPWPDKAPEINEEFFLDERFNGIAENLTGSGALAGNQVGWSFITAPEDVSWDIANQATRVDMFGTNNPPVVAGSRGMRDLTLGNALVEGFVRNVTIEGKVEALEKLMNYSLNASDGFVSVPVYQVWAQKKQYAGTQGYFIIKDVRVKETMRDLTGKATRAYVDISLMQVPAYQVNSGRDQASATTSGAKSGLLSQAQVNAAQATDGKGAQAAAAKQVDAVKNAAAVSNPSGAKSAQPGTQVNPVRPTPGRPLTFPRR